MNRVFEIFLLASLSIVSPTRMLSAEPPSEPQLQLGLPPSLTIMIDYGGEPALLFTEPMWAELSRLLWMDRQEAVTAGVDAAVKVAVLPWMVKAERQAKWLTLGLPILAAIVVVETVILVLR